MKIYPSKVKGFWKLGLCWLSSMEPFSDLFISVVVYVLKQIKLFTSVELVHPLQTRGTVTLLATVKF